MVGFMLSRMFSVCREKLNRLSMVIFRNERFRKKCVIAIYNVTAFFKKNKSGDHSLFEPECLIRNERFFCHDVYKGNFLYGMSDVLKKYSGYTDKVCSCIEHGVYFGDYFNDKEAIKSGYPSVITFSSQRKAHIRKVSDKMVFEVGPYIYYASSVLDEKAIKMLKKQWGKTLLVWPSHSVDRIKTSFDYQQFIHEILKIKQEHGFETVLTCLYYRDIELQRNKVYEEAGFKVVTAGRREDPAFLERLKTFILLSDYTVSNSVGTHVGYSVVLNRPHTVLEQRIDFEMDSAAEQKHVTTLYLNSADQEKAEVQKAFATYSETISDRQRELCRKYWGIDKIRTPEELYAIFQLNQSILKLAKGKESKFNEYAKMLLSQIDQVERELLFKALQ